MKKMKWLAAFFLAVGILTQCPVISHAVVSNTVTQTTTSLGDGSTVNFTISFDFRDNSQVTVVLVDTSFSPVHTTALIYGSGAGKFTITGGNPGTTVHMGTAPTSVQYLIIGRSIPLTQPVNFDPASAFPVSSFSNQLDLMTLQLQNLNAEVTGVAGTSTVLGSSLSIPSALPDNFVGYNHAGTSTIQIPGSTVTLNSGDVLQYSGSGWGTYNLTNSGLITTINNGVTPIVPGAGGTGVSNSGLLSWGSHALTFALVGDTSVTLPTSGTLLAGTLDTGNTANTVVKRDSSGNFASNQITANTFVGALTGNVTGNVTGNTSGTAANVTGTVAIGHGGSGQTTQQGAINALTGSQTSGYFLRSDGTNASLQPIGITDVPQGFSRLKLAQDTPNTVVINDASGNLSVVPAGTSGNVLTSNGVSWVSAAAGAGTVGQGVAYGADVGAINAYAINPSPAVIGYNAGLTASFKAASTNTGAATLNINGLGAKTIKQPGGGTLLAGDILNGQLTQVTYDGTNFQLSSQQGPAVVTNTASTIVKRDANGDFSASTVTASLTGHASLDLPLAGGTMSGAIAMGTSKITGMGDPTLAQDAATKSYVDSQLAQLNPADSVQAATTANIAGTYTNAVSGVCVGDTFQATSTATFSLDGYTPSVGARLLFKDQTSTFQGGVWTLTTLANVGIAGAIFTRASDMNSSADFNAGQIIPIINGTVNAGASYFQTATNTTCNSSAQTWTQFQKASSAYLLKASNLSDVASVATAQANISPLTTKGDLWGFSTINGRLVVGSNNQILTADSSSSFGFKWAPAPSASALTPLTKTANYTITSSDTFIIADTSSGSFTLTFPAASGTSGIVFYIKVIGNNPLTLARTGSDLIDGETSQTVSVKYTGLVYISDGSSNYYGF